MHSPFVYSLVDKCLATKIDKKFLSTRKKIFQTLKKSNLSIEIVDFGAGSKKLGLQRKIASIFAISSSKGKYGFLLYKLAHFYQPKTILEFGTSLGIGTIHLQAGNPTSKITTVEACPNTLGVAIQNFKSLNCENIHPIQATFNDFLTSYTGEKFDLVFIDGHHDGEALLSYLERLQVHTHNETIFILDDIRWSDSMLEAWKKITDDPNYHLTIDFFRMGIVARRTQQHKEHFTIKI